MRILIAVAALLGLGVAPAFGAAVPVASNSLAAFHTCVLSGISSTSTVDTESYVNQASTSQNNGTATTMTVNSASGANTRSYVRFDLTMCAPAIASNATIRSALVRLYATVIPAVCRTQDIFRVTSAWTETAITWSNQPFGTTINNPATGSATAQMPVGSGCTTNNAASAYVTGWNVTTDVQAFAAGTATNNGWMIRDDTEGSSTSRTSTYSTREAASAPHAPQLVIDYS